MNMVTAFYLEDRTVTTLSCQVNYSITIVVHFTLKILFKFLSFMHGLKIIIHMDVHITHYY